MDARADINYPSFPNSSGLTLLNAAVVNGGVLSVTPSTFAVSGQAWYQQPQDVADPFRTTFQFQITDLQGLGPGADGFAFVIQNQGLGAAGGGGSDIGYGGIPDSVAVEFDTFQFGNNDPNGNHISVHTRGTQPNSADEQYSLGNTGTGLAINLKDGLVHAATLLYEPGTLSVYLDSLIMPVLTVPLNLPNTLTLTGGTAYVGFTAGTGAGQENHNILNWTFAPAPEPSSLALAILGAPALAAYLWRRRRARYACDALVDVGAEAFHQPQ
jgi:peptide-N4-(N-acetyl-beta-glucosaminyl)asparagine amidase